MFKKINALYLVNFLSSFLLFQIELIIAKIFLPQFGGSFLVWGGCVVFFQCALFLGYFYSHLVTKFFGGFRYRYFHLLLTLLPLAFFPGRSLPLIVAHHNIPLVADIFFQLSISVGLVFFVLSTISVISQNWLAASTLKERSNPYILYAVSNAGSFLGLLTYPFIFEANFGLKDQLLIWRICYLVFILSYALAFKIITYMDQTRPKFKWEWPKMFSSQIRLGDFFGEKFKWIFLSAAACIAFLSVTNIITYEVAPCPLIWIIPLSIYLISFTLTFREKPICPSWIKDKFYLVLGFSAILYFLTIQNWVFPVLLMIAAHFICLFAICMYCQYHLYISRPKDNADLTSFYLLISFGGLLGSFFVTWVAPVVFSSTCEYLLGLGIISLVYIFAGEKKRISYYHLRLMVYFLLLITLWPLVFKTYNFWGIIFLLLAVKVIFSGFKTNLRSVSLCLAAVFCLSFFIGDNWRDLGKTIYIQRNYYGVLRVTDVFDHVFELYHGRTVHGVEFIPTKLQNVPLAYYYEKTPVGKVLESNDFIFQHIGAIGLGVGTVSAYGRAGQTFDFFELDHDVYWIAENLFGYLKNTKAKTNFIFGDARISLKNIPDQSYDLLIVDAFSGDAVPVHLLTTDAMLEYKRCLKKNGIILFHISNKSFNLAPILFSNAPLIKAYSLESENYDVGAYCFSSKWVALTWDKGKKDLLVSKLGWNEEGLKHFHVRKIRPWTDDYTNLISLINIRDLINEVRNFKPLYWGAGSH